MAPSHLAGVLLELTDREVTVRDGNRRSDHAGSLSVWTDRTGGAVTIGLDVDRPAASERAMSVSLPTEDVAALEAALAAAGEED